MESRDLPDERARVVSLLGLLGLAVATEVLLPHNKGSGHLKAEKGTTEACTDARGRAANTPLEISALGWKDILLRLYSNISKHRVMAMAAGATYYSILAFFPAIAALVAMYGMFSDPSTIAKHLDQLRGFLPGGAIDVAGEQLTRVAWKGSQTLGLTFLVGLGASVWSANAAMKSLFDTLNIVYSEEEKRGFVMLNAVSLGFTIGGVLFMLAALGSIVLMPVVLDYVGLSSFGDRLLRIGRWPAMYLHTHVRLGRNLSVRSQQRGAQAAMDYLGVAQSLPCCGSPSRGCSPGMPPTSVGSTRPTALSGT
jgi:membrane protein